MDRAAAALPRHDDLDELVGSQKFIKSLLADVVLLNLDYVIHLL